MKAICKSCNTTFDFKPKGETKCPSCGALYKNTKEPKSFEIKLLNGTFLDKLSYNDVKDGILNAKFLSVDFVAYDDTPWIKIKDSIFSKFLKGGNIEVKSESSSGFWKVMFFISLLLNIGMLAVLYYFKLKIVG